MDHWLQYINTLVGTASLNVSAAALGAHSYKSSKSTNALLSAWATKKQTGLAALRAIHPEKLNELSRHIVIDLSSASVTAMSVKDVLKLSTSNVPAIDYVCGYVSGISQIFPTYTQVPEHVAMCNDFLKASTYALLRGQYSADVFVIKDRYYMTAHVGMAPYAGMISPVKEGFWRLFDDADASDFQLKDMAGDLWDLIVLENNRLDWCTFIIKARRSVLKDFDLHPNCFCTKIAQGSGKLLNRKDDPTDASKYTHMVTVFDINDTATSMLHSLAEKESIKILSQVKELLTS